MKEYYIIWNLKEKAFLVLDPDGYEKVGWTHEIDRATEFLKKDAKEMSMQNTNDIPILSPYRSPI